MEARNLDIKTAVAGVVDTQHKRVSGESANTCLHAQDLLMIVLIWLGKNWKLQKTPTVRAQKAKSLRKAWAQRMEERNKLQAAKALEKQMKDEIQAEKDVSQGTDLPCD